MNEVLIAIFNTNKIKTLFSSAETDNVIHEKIGALIKLSQESDKKNNPQKEKIRKFCRIKKPND